MTQTLAPGFMAMVSVSAVPSMAALKRSTMSVSRRSRRAWVSGSPKRVLNSRTIGRTGAGLRGHHDAAEEDALEGRALAAMPSTTGWATLG
jgi:hypothetical protein